MSENENNVRPDVTVIIPAHGDAPFLGGAAGAPVGGVLGNANVIIVDDGLSEKGRTLAENIGKNEKVRLLDGEKRGQSAARNLGLREADGQYVMFLDCDDMYLNGMGEVVAAAKANNADVMHIAGYFMTTQETYIHLEGKTRVTPVKEFGHEKILKLEGSPEDFVRYFMKDETTWTIGTKLFRREFLLENNIFFPENVNLGEGMLFALPCLVLAKTYMVAPHVCYFYRQTEDGLLRKPYDKDDLTDVFNCEADGLKIIDEFFAAHADVIQDKTLADKAKDYFLRPMENIIERVNNADPDLWSQMEGETARVFNDRLLADGWWREHIFGGYARRTREKQHLIMVQQALKEQIDAADGLIDKTLSAPRIIVVASIYTLMLCTLLFRDWEKSIILCGGGIPKEVFANMQKMGLTCYAPEGGAFVSPRILETVTRYAVRHSLPIFGNDDTPEAVHFVKMDFTAVEDGTANYNYERAMERPEARRITPDGSVYVPFGFSEWVKKILLTGKQAIPEQVKDKVKLIDPQKLWDKKSPQEKERIFKLYSFPGKELKQMIKKGKDVLLIGECYATVGICTDEQEMSMYREIMEPYGEDRIIFKPHHQDKRDFAKIFPQAAILPRYFPIDLMKLIGLRPRRVITPYSSAAFGLFPRKIVELRMDVMEKHGIKIGSQKDRDAMKQGEDDGEG